MASDVRCVCPCHTHSGTYPPPCNVCGHDTREGRWVGGYRGWWEPNNDPRDEQIARLTSENARLKRENAALREALLSDCPTVEGDRDHPCWCEAGALNHLQDCWTKRAALAARGGEVQG